LKGRGFSRAVIAGTKQLPPSESCPGGTNELSPALQRWVAAQKMN
jgi:hypothetical protein